MYTMRAITTMLTSMHYAHTTTKGRTTHAPLHYTTYIPTHCAHTAPTIKEHTMDTPTHHTNTQGGMDMDNHTPMYTTPYPTQYIRPIHRTYALLFTLCTLMCMVGTAVWLYTPVTYVFNGWGFFLMWANALVGMPLFAYRYIAEYRWYRGH